MDETDIAWDSDVADKVSRVMPLDRGVVRMRCQLPCRDKRQAAPLGEQTQRRVSGCE